MQVAFYTNRALALNKLGRYAESIRDCDLAIGRDPEFLKAYHYKADAIIKLGKGRAFLLFMLLLWRRRRLAASASAAATAVAAAATHNAIHPSIHHPLSFPSICITHPPISIHPSVIPAEAAPVASAALAKNPPAAMRATLEKMVISASAAQTAADTGIMAKVQELVPCVRACVHACVCACHRLLRRLHSA